MENDADPAGLDAQGDEPVQEDILDRYDDAVIAADATGMIAGERLITVAEIEEGLQTGTPD